MQQRTAELGSKVSELKSSLKRVSFSQNVKPGQPCNSEQLTDDEELVEYFKGLVMNNIEVFRRVKQCRHKLKEAQKSVALWERRLKRASRDACTVLDQEDKEDVF